MGEYAIVIQGEDDDQVGMIQMKCGDIAILTYSKNPAVGICGDICRRVNHLGCFIVENLTRRSAWMSEVGADGNMVRILDVEKIIIQTIQ